MLGRGVSADSITVGFFRNKNLGAGYAALGIAPGDPDAQKQVLVDDVNARGGINGRRVVPVWVESDAVNDTDATRSQRACAAFTQDHEVFAVLSPQLPTDAYVACLEQAGVVSITASLSQSDERTFLQFPHYFEAQTFNLTRLARLKVEELHAQGFFTPSSRIGLVRYDTPRYRRAVTEALLPALRARGLELTEEFALSRVENVNGFFAQQSQLSSAVTKFKHAGIDRVLFLALDLSAPDQFLGAAREQQFRPRYALDTQDSPAHLALKYPEQLVDAVGFGWAPLVDVPESGDPGENGSRRRCLALLASKGHHPPSRGHANDMTWLCDLVWFFEAAAGRAPELNVDGFARGVESLGESFLAASAERTWFAPGRHDGAAGYRRLAFSPTCACFVYTSDVVGAP